jgi:RNA polymerase sigma-70 factor (ECF subfamily)
VPSSATRNPSLLQRVARGEPSAVQQCIDAHGSLVWSLARRLCPKDADAEDAVQEIFITLWRKAGQYDPSLSAESTWVAAVARSKLLDLRRRVARRGRPEELGEELASGAPGQAELAERADEAARATRALAELRSEQRRVLELAVVHGLTYEQVAARLALPLGTVKTHARRGLARVRELLGLRRLAGQEGTPS